MYLYISGSSFYTNQPTSRQSQHGCESNSSFIFLLIFNLDITRAQTKQSPDLWPDSKKMH